MNSLFAKLSAALLAIVLTMGAALFAVERGYTRAYYEELSQKLNAPIAMYVTEQRQLIENGKPDLDSLRDLAAHAMVINPTAEIYLLDPAGRILGHNLPDNRVLLERIDLEPVHELIAGTAVFPLRGDDPRNAESTKVFSAAEVRSGQGTEGYLYVVLGGAQYEALASDIGESYVFRSSAAAAATIVLFTAVIGFLVFRVLTRRLKRLSGEMQRVTESRFALEPDLPRLAADGDEIDALGRSFLDMSRQIRRQIDQLRENDRLRRELVSNISHDLRTPLSAMQGSIETLLIKGESITGEERDRYLRIARKHTLRLGTLIGDLFELAKLDSASVAPSIEAFSLPELVQDIAQEFQHEAERKNIRLHVDADAATAFTLGDIGLIQRVLENLVRNAVQFTPAAGDITISITQSDSSVAIAVSDNGPGIAETDLPRIFDRFYRALDGEEARSDSSGLGLAIVKRILDLHDSRITVTSTANHGTRFEFALPISERAA
ncbi:MAG: HAMP domain-containing histidine kinase [Gammaproteobacteria bacterium]|nr:HAMP domain-containing histidine kinase [Gammaproteobacteria bacterium]